MPWPLFRVLARVPARLLFYVIGPSSRGARARWWSGRALCVAALNFCVAALLVIAMVTVALHQHVLADTGVTTPLAQSCASGATKG